jgi:parallel beta-helix repeat protein
MSLADDLLVAQSLRSSLATHGAPQTVLFDCDQLITNLTPMSLQNDLATAQALQTSLTNHGAPAKVLTDASQLVSDLQAQINPPSGPSFYSSPSGSDSNPGTLALPFKTIAKGLTKLTPGATLYLRAGTYAETISDSIPSGSSWSSPVTVASYPGETAIIEPSSASIVISIQTRSYIILQNLVVDGTHVFSGGDAIKITYSSSTTFAHHIRVTGCEVRNTPGQGILITKGSTTAGVDYNEVLGCYIHDNGVAGSNQYHGIYAETNHNLIQGNDISGNVAYQIQLYASSGTPGSTTYCSYNTVTRNKLRGSKIRSGIVLGSGTGNLISNNLVYGNSDGGVYLNYGCAGTMIENNTVYGNSGSGGTAGIEIDSATGTIVRNNISYNNHTDYHDIGTGTVQDHNLLSVDPKFVNAAGNDYHIQSTSPAKNAGVTLSAVPTDFDGLTRPQSTAYCIGAYEDGA